MLHISVHVAPLIRAQGVRQLKCREIRGDRVVPELWRCVNGQFTSYHLILTKNSAASSKYDVALKRARRVRLAPFALLASAELVHAAKQTTVNANTAYNLRGFAISLMALYVRKFATCRQVNSCWHAKKAK